jgi:enoyl-CoA hydratase/carnithine racemase
MEAFRPPSSGPGETRLSMRELQVERFGAISLLTLDRPSRLNALGRSLLQELRNAMADFEADPDQQVAVITGAGDRAFSSGGDLAEVASGDTAPIAGAPDIAGVGAVSKVTIAAVNGLAVGGGLELALCCDIRIAAEHAVFSAPEAGWGLVPGVAASLLPRHCSIGDSLDLLLGGAPWSAAEAMARGLVQQVVSGSDLIASALSRAEAIARQSPAAVRGTKQVVGFWRDLVLGEQHRLYETIAQGVLLTGDPIEGTRAFMQKRAPRFAGSTAVTGTEAGA